MAGIYIHIPFCRRKCHYCNFFSIASLKYKQHFLEALHEEIYLQRAYLAGKEIKSVYFGGGTPSLLDPAEISNVLSEIRKYHLLCDDPEITLEANPDDVSTVLLSEFKQTGINRLSIGIQSFYDDDLEYLNRIHSSEKAINSVREAKKAGFGNISIDLIYGIPTLTDEKWRKNLEIAFSMDVQHISAYSLTVEPRTALDVLIRKKKLPAPAEERIIDHFRLLMEVMRNNKFIHYEISNFCREGFYSKHNSMYWNGEHYLGLGPSAHSFNGSSRQWNFASVIEYIDQVKRKDRFFETEILTKDQKYNEYVMTSLRTIWGCDLNKIRDEFGEEFAVRSSQFAVQFIESGMIVEKEGVYYLSDEGKLFADGIASDLFMDHD
jgi:oxygen-independent coproporphyrinogen III oxidase